MEIRFERCWPASLEEVWSLVSNTDAFNRIAGFGMKFHSSTEGWRGNQRVGPWKVTWLERPMNYTEPTQFLSVRQFDNGPILEAKTSVALEEVAEGTKLLYTVQLEPRGMASMLSPVIGMLVRPGIERGLKAVERALQGGPSALDPPPPLDKAALARAEQALAHLDGRYRNAILQRIERAPLVVQRRLRPLAMARADGLDEHALVRGCLAAVNAGVLELSWEVLCPRCQAGKAELSVLDLSVSDVHCETCDIRYDGSLADNMEAVFRPATWLRDEVVPVDCVLSPSRTPHVIAQLDLAPLSQVMWESRLNLGCYGVRSDLGSALIEVSDEHDAVSTVVLELRETGLFPSVIRVAPGTTDFVVRSRIARPAWLQLARRWRPPHVLTASRLLTHADLRDALPKAVLAADLGTNGYPGAAAVVEAEPEVLDQLLDQLGELPGLHRMSNATAVVPTDGPPEALLVAERLVSQRLRVGVGLASGLVLELSHGGRTALAGEAVEYALDAVRRVGAPQVAVSRGSIESFQAVDAKRHRLKTREGLPALIAFASRMDGSPELTDSRGPMGEEPVEEGPLPKRVAGLQVLRELDRGGMGRVLEVLDEQSGERLAVKQVLPGRLNDAVIQQFFREAYYASQIVHPNVVRFVDWGTDEGLPYLVMEVLVGRSLQAHMKRIGRMERADAVSVISALLDALGAVHAAGLVHRDIKPQNLFVLEDPSGAPGGIKLLDFGLMRRHGRDRAETLAGTPDYMAPEQVLMESLDARADLYSVAILGYALLTGARIFSGRTVGQRAISRLDFDPADLLDDERLGTLGPVLSRALAPEPDDRYPSAEEMRAAVLAAK